MVNPKLRRVFASIALISALSMLPAQAAGFAPREPRRASFVERVEHWGASAWSFLIGWWEKRGTSVNPDGAMSTAVLDDGGR